MTINDLRAVTAEELDNIENSTAQVIRICRKIQRQRTEDVQTGSVRWRVNATRLWNAIDSLMVPEPLWQLMKCLLPDAYVDGFRFVYWTDVGGEPSVSVPATLSLKQAARLCKVAPRTVSKWFDSGRLKGFRLPGTQKRRIPMQDLLDFLDTHKMEKPTLKDMLQIDASSLMA